MQILIYFHLMKLIRFPGIILLHIFFAVSITLHILSLLHQDFAQEAPLSHIIQISSYAAGWILISLDIKYREYIFPFAVVFPWAEHIRLLVRYFMDPSLLAFWICLLVVVLMPLLVVLLFRSAAERSA